MAWTRGPVIIGWRNRDSGSNRLAARVEISQLPIGCAAAGEIERERKGDRPGDRSIEELLEFVLECLPVDSDREHLAGRAPAREAGRLVGSEDHAGLGRRDDPLRSAVGAGLPGADEVDLVGVHVRFGVDPNLGAYESQPSVIGPSDAASRLIAKARRSPRIVSRCSR